MTNSTAQPSRVVLAVNAGSGTVSATAYAIDDRPGPGERVLDPVWQLDVVRHTDPQTVTIRGGDTTIEYNAQAGRLDLAVAPAIPMLFDGPLKVVDRPADVLAVGHRIVHGGTCPGPATITPHVRDMIERFAVLAPLHNRAGLELFELFAEATPASLHVAVFDTSFHATMPIEATAFGGPIEWVERGLRRYGFHGISHEDAARRAALVLGRPLANLGLITVHLGGGCSVAAIDGGRSVDTTMGATPTDGLLMATRSGTIDPGVLIHLMRQDQLDIDELERLVNQRCGLMGLTSGRTGDIVEVHRLAVQGDSAARLAQDLYIRSIADHIAGLRNSLPTLDALVFTGSAVEGEPWLRESVVERIGHLGLEIDTQRNDATDTDTSDRDVATTESPARIVSVVADENRSIARAALRLLGDR